ncbi:MAG TPA: ScpA family protein [Gaiellaceae bacterium]|nr:ScpA family protein [Gaiellaceae bacterium]
MPVTPVRELELDLDAFEGPFDLLLTLLLKEELEPREVDMAAIVVSFVEILAEREELDLEACGEFLVLISALLELKARALFPDEAAELADLEPEEAAEELARRLAEYRRMKEAAAWLSDRLSTEQDRWFRLGPAPLAPRGERRLAPQEPDSLATALRALAAPPPNVSLGHMALRFPPVSQFLERFRALLSRRSRFDFDAEVVGLSRVEQAVAFLALLELRKAGEIGLSQAAPFAPIRVSLAAPVGGRASGRSPAPGPPAAAELPMSAGAVPSTVPSGLAGSATTRSREEGAPPLESERTATWTARSA